MVEVRGLARAAAVLGLGALGACAAVPAEQLGTVPARSPLPSAERLQSSPLEIEDPWEGLNRRIYQLNTQLDRWVLLPVVRAYEYVLPEPVQLGIGNFFANLGEVRNAVNAALQLRGDVFGTAIGRLLINTTVGAGGLFDLASIISIEEHREDFGQTLGRWGVPDGPYLVLPILGPSNLRDTGGLAIDRVITTTAPGIGAVDEAVFSDPAILGLSAIDARHQIGFRYYLSGSPFEYTLVRYLYTKKRQLDVLK